MSKVSIIMTYNAQGELLLGRRNDNKKWTLPAGHMEGNETPLQCARRELQEETGLEPKALSYLTEYTLEDGTELYCFTALVSGEPHSENDPDNEVSKWEWVDVTNGLPKKYYKNLHGPTEDYANIVMRIFDIKKAEKDFYIYRDGAIAIPEVAHPKRLEYERAFLKALGSFFDVKDIAVEIIPIDKIDCKNGVINQKRFDFYKSIYMQGDLPPPGLAQIHYGRYLLLDGNHRFAAAKAVGEETYVAYVVESELSKSNAEEIFDSIYNEEIVFENLSKANKDEIERLLEHPSHIHHKIALKLQGVSPKHIGIALANGQLTWEDVTGHPAYNEDAIDHFVTLFCQKPHSDARINLDAIFNDNKAPVNEYNYRKLYENMVRNNRYLEIYGIHHPEALDAAQKTYASNYHSFPLEALVIKGPVDIGLDILENHINALSPIGRYDIIGCTKKPAILQWFLDNGTPQEQAQVLTSPFIRPDVLIKELMHFRNNYKAQPQSPRAAAAICNPTLPKTILHNVFDKAVFAGVDPVADRLIHYYIKGTPKEKFDSKVWEILLKAYPELEYEALVKFVEPSDVFHVVHAGTDNFKQISDHVQEYHPEHVNESKDLFHNHIIKSPDAIKTNPNVEGQTPKTIAAVPDVSGNGHKFMMKPEHENMEKHDMGWAKMPIAGWAEGSSQALYHAAGIHHLHQKSFAYEHEMEGKKHALRVIHMDSGTSPFFSANPTPKVQDQARKIALMDFLQNNLDRHGGNLLAKDGNLLAIDNALGFQYLNDNKINASYATLDRIKNYIDGRQTKFSVGMVAPLHDMSISNRDDRDMKALEDWKPVIEKWWPSVRDNMVNAMQMRLGLLKDESVRQHVKTNFYARVDQLDDMAKMGLDNFGTDWYNTRVEMNQDHIFDKYPPSNPEEDEYDAYSNT